MPNIEIIVKEQTTGEGTSPSQQTMAASAGETQRTPDQEQGKPSIAQQAVIGGIVQVAKQQIANGVTQYVNLTGDYATANAVSAATGIVGDLMIAVKGGPVGILYVASRYATELINSQVQQINLKRELEFRTSLLGQVSVKGSRY